MPRPHRLKTIGSGPEAAVLATVAAGGAIGAAARYLIGQEWPTPRGGFPFGTLGINILGCALIGILMVLITDVWISQRLIRPFLGTGVLGGFTTFSTYAVDVQGLATGSHLGTALLYLAATPLGALLAVWSAVTATRRMVGTKKTEGTGAGHPPLDAPEPNR